MDYRMDCNCNCSCNNVSDSSFFVLLEWLVCLEFYMVEIVVVDGYWNLI